MDKDQLERARQVLRQFVGDELPDDLSLYLEHYEQYGVIRRWQYDAILAAADRLSEDFLHGRRSPWVPANLRGPCRLGVEWQPRGRPGRTVGLEPSRHLGSNGLLVGETGAGKTLLEQSLAQGLLPLPDGPALWFVPLAKPGEFDGFIRLYDDFFVLPADALPWNLFAPPTDATPAQTESYRAHTIATLARESLLSERGRDLVDAVLEKLFAELGVSRGGDPPTLPRVIEALRHMEFHPLMTTERLHPEVRRAALSTLISLYRRVPRAWRIYSRGWTVEDLAELKLAFDFHAVGLDLARLVTYLFLTSHFEHQVAKGLVAVPSVQLVVFLVDAWELLTASDSALSRLIITCRGAGTSVFADTQSTRNIPDVLLRNLTTKFYCRGSELPQDTRLQPVHHAVIRDQLHPLVTLASLAGHMPFLVRYNKVALSPVTPSEIEARLAVLRSRLSTPKLDPIAATWDWDQPVHLRTEPASTPAETTTTSPTPSAARARPVRSLAILQCIADHAAERLGTNGLAATFGGKKATFIADCHALEDEGLLSADTSLAPKRVLRVTAEGVAALERGHI